MLGESRPSITAIIIKHKPRSERTQALEVIYAPGPFSAKDINWNALPMEANGVLKFPGEERQLKLYSCLEERNTRIYYD